MRKWLNETGWVLELHVNERTKRSYITLTNAQGRDVVTHSYDYWQQREAVEEAEALATLGHMLEKPVDGYAKVEVR